MENNIGTKPSSQNPSTPLIQNAERLHIEVKDNEGVKSVVWTFIAFAIIGGAIAIYYFWPQIHTLFQGH